MNASDAFARVRKTERGHALDYPDGSVEFVGTNAVTGPDQVGGQNFGMSYLYVRFVRPDGSVGPWRRSICRGLASSLMEASHWGSCYVAASAVSEPESEAGDGG